MFNHSLYFLIFWIMMLFYKRILNKTKLCMHTFHVIYQFNIDFSHINTKIIKMLNIETLYSS